MLVKFHFLEKYNVNFDWKTLYVGVYSNFIEIQELTKYAEKVLVSQPELESEFVNELAWGTNGVLKDELLLKMTEEFQLYDLTEGSDLWNKEIRKWRYCMLKYVLESEKNDKDVLKRVSEVYAEVGYPIEMENFIPYMSPKDGYELSKHTEEENIRRLMNLLISFVQKEESEITE